MIDLHIHILPGIDDGARSPEDALEMARIAADSGARAMAATSHGDFSCCDPAEYHSFPWWSTPWFYEWQEMG